MEEAKRIAVYLENLKRLILERKISEKDAVAKTEEVYATWRRLSGYVG